MVFNKKRFLKYQLFPVIFLIYATGITLFLMTQIMDVKQIPIQVTLIIIIGMIVIWSLTITVNIDANHKELRDILNKRLPENSEESK